MVPHHRARARRLARRALAAHRRRRRSPRSSARRRSRSGTSPSSTRRSTPFRSLGIAIVSWLMVRWCDDPDGRRPTALLVLDRVSAADSATRTTWRACLPRPAVGAGRARFAGRATLLRWKLLLACVGALAARHHAVRDAADPRRALPGDQRRRADGVPRRASSVGCTFCKATYDRVHVQLQSRPVRQAGAERAAGAVRRRRSGCGGCTSSGSGCATRTTTIRSCRASLAALFLVLGGLGGYVHWQRDRRSFWYFGPLMFTMTLAAHLLPELQVRRVAGAGARRQRRARGARPRLLLPLELLGVGRVGGARPRLRVGDRRRAHRIARR